MFAGCSGVSKFTAVQYSTTEWEPSLLYTFHLPSFGRNFGLTKCRTRVLGLERERHLRVIFRRPVRCIRMFILTTVSDLVQIQPHDLGKPTSHALEDNISAKYCNRVPPSSIISITDTTRRADVSQVIQQVGLCICLFDVLYASDGRVGTGTGIVNINGTSSESHAWSDPTHIFPQWNFVSSFSVLLRVRSS